MGRRAPLFLTAIGVSSFLLFSLELYAGRIVLPAFGGSPAVWTTTLCFFTGTVFLGYLYAHVVATHLSRRAGGLVHITLTAVALAAALLAPADLAVMRFESLQPALNVLVVLAATVGVPAFLLSTTTPLLSAWFAGEHEDPWWLYAVSNAASLAGLIAYPFLVEPRVPLSMQRVSAQGLLAVLALTLAVVVIDGWRRGPVAGPLAEALPLPSRARQATWLFAACVPAGLLSAVTTHLATDHVSSPLLWVGPLGVYLASFVIAFSARGRRTLPWVSRLVPAAATLMWIPFLARIDWPVLVLVPMLLACYAILAVAVHGRLAVDRPAAAHLTRFYLILSAGGLLATAFVALVAPVVFTDVYEYPLFIVGSLMALALLDRPATPRVPPSRDAALKCGVVRLAPLAVAGALLLASVANREGSPVLFVGVLLFVGAVVVALGATPRSLSIGTVLALAVVMLAFVPAPLVRVRTFFGITEVRETADGAALAEIHGTTLHGLQYTDSRRTEPTAYFVRSGPLGDIVSNVYGRTPTGAHIGVVGLGAGTIATYARSTDALTYYEIDESVVDLARDPRYFTYLADARVRPAVIVGDGRLSLERADARSFDLLVLDAFSSDAVPAHLLTREAMTTYARTLKPGGLIAFQLTNRHFDLTGAVAATAGSLGLDSRMRSFTPDATDVRRLSADPSTWMVVGATGDVAAFDAQGWSPAGTGPVLTDDYADLMRLLK